MRKHVPLPTVDVIDFGLTQELVPSDARQEDGPNNPVYSTSSEDTDTNKTMQVVRQAHVDVLALIRRDERRDYEVDVREQEQESNGPGRAEWR